MICIPRNKKKKEKKYATDVSTQFPCLDPISMEHIKVSQKFLFSYMEETAKKTKSNFILHFI
jgi:hypothetical protein